MTSIEIKAVSKRFAGAVAIKDFSASLAPGCTSAVIGPSGAGKSTLLRIVAGLELPDSGTVAINGVDVSRLSPSGRSIAMLTQDYALYPQQSIEKNLQAALKSLKLSRQEQRERICEALQTLGIEGLAKRLPSQLSGGERQRAALGRAIVRRPSLLLLDEPLSQLDVPLKVELRQLLCDLSARLSMTTLAVLHDPLDAMMMADTLYVLEQGSLVQFGSPEQVYRYPRNMSSVKLLSRFGVNWLTCDSAAAGLLAKLGGGTVDCFGAIGFRPESAKLVATECSLADSLSIPVSSVQSRCVGDSQWSRCVCKTGSEVIEVACKPEENMAGKEGWVVVQKADLLVRSGESVSAFQELAERPPNA